MMQKEFKFEKAFEELENDKFGNYENVKYFGIKKDSKSDELRNQVEVLYYNSKDDFAIKLKTKQEDEVILCKNPRGNTFNKIYQNIEKEESKYKGNKRLQEKELLKVPNIKMNEKTEFAEIQNKFIIGYYPQIDLRMKNDTTLFIRWNIKSKKRWKIWIN